MVQARFYKLAAAGAMAGGPKDFGGTKELVQLFGPPEAGRTKELGGPKWKSEQTAGGTKRDISSGEVPK